MITLGHVLAPFQPLAKELLGRMLVPTALHQNIQHSTVLVDRPPEIMALTINREQHLIEVPRIARPGTPTAQLIGVLLTKRAAPLADRFIRDNDPAGKPPFFDIVIAEAEPEIEPDLVADDLDREAVVLIAVEGWCVHALSMAHQASVRQAAQQVDNTFIFPIPYKG
jgi:hypothetical protein